ncbi:MAG: calcium-binding protein [Microcoleaceae cyanobacterium]
MANVLVDAGFPGGFAANRNGALGTTTDDNITLPTELRSSTGALINGSVDGSNLEILLLAGDDVLNTAASFPATSKLIINGNTGSDFILGGPAEDTIFGGQDADVLGGEAKNDQIFGNLGNDFDLFGGLGDDSVFGGQGNDTGSGNDGNDQIFGDRGNDFIIGNGGVDLLTGGPDSDGFGIDPSVETPTFDPAFVDRIADFSTSATDGDTIFITGLAAPTVGFGGDIVVGNLTTIGSTQGFVISEGITDVNGNGIFGEAITFVVNNAAITRPLDATDFV